MIEYWTDHLQNTLPLLQRFTKKFVLEGLSIILKFSYFYTNKSYSHQIKGTAMSTKFAVVGTNLVVAYKETIGTFTPSIPTRIRCFFMAKLL